jgi:hypothetical protein
MFGQSLLVLEVQMLEWLCSLAKRMLRLSHPTTLDDVGGQCCVHLKWAFSLLLATISQTLAISNKILFPLDV